MKILVASLVRSLDSSSAALRSSAIAHASTTKGGAQYRDSQQNLAIRHGASFRNVGPQCYHVACIVSMRGEPYLPTTNTTNVPGNVGALGLGSAADGAGLSPNCAAERNTR